jgi:hypothetical protein
MHTRKIFLGRSVDGAELSALEGERPCEKHFATIIDYDADAYCATSGRLIFKFRKGVISPEHIHLAKSVYSDIDSRMVPSWSRNSASGKIELARFQTARSDVVAIHPHPKNPFKGYLELSSGTRLKSPLSNPVMSFLAGYNYDRYRKLGNLGGFSKQFPDEWERSVSFFEAIGGLLDLHLPDVSQVMHKWCADHKVSPAFTIGRSCLSTVAVNVNYESCFHYDRGDMNDGFSSLTTISVGKGYAGGHLVIPAYQIAIDIREGDLLLNQSHVELHGNLSVIQNDKFSKRISFVTYLKGTLRHATNWIDHS